MHVRARRALRLRPRAQSHRGSMQALPLYIKVITGSGKLNAGTGLQSRWQAALNMAARGNGPYARTDRDRVMMVTSTLETIPEPCQLYTREQGVCYTQCTQQQQN